MNSGVMSLFRRRVFSIAVITCLGTCPSGLLHAGMHGSGRSAVNASVTEMHKREKESGPEIKSANVPLGGGYFFERSMDRISGTLDACADAKYLALLDGAQLYFRKDGLSYVFRRLIDSGAADGDVHQRFSVFRIDVSFPGSFPHVVPEADEETDAVIHVLHGPGSERTGRTFKRIIYRNLYDRIDLVFRITGRGIKYDFVVHPGADPRHIGIAYDGAGTIEPGSDGSVVVRHPLGELIEDTPVAYETGSGIDDCDKERVFRGSSFTIDNNVLHFSIPFYDSSKTLVIDPGIFWSTYLGGSGEDRGYDVGVDAQKNVYVTGTTVSVNFPVLAGQQMTLIGQTDGFVSKFDSTGSLLWSTYFGGSDIDISRSLTVDATGVSFVTGWTRSTDFPMLNPIQSANAGDVDIFLLKLSPDGLRLWSSYYGGTQEDQGMDVVRDGSGNYTIVGRTVSYDFPVSGASQAIIGGSSDAFLLKVTGSGTRIWATYYGGSNDDDASGCGIDASGNVVIGGSTKSVDLPMLNAQQATYADNRDAFVAKFNTSGARLWSTYCGGSEGENGTGVACDPVGNVYLTGNTASSDFPVLSAYQEKKSIVSDGFVVKYNPSGSMQWSTYYGGNSTDYPSAISMDNFQNVIIVGSTGSVTLPLVNAQQMKVLFGDDAFAARFSPNGILLWSTYLGGLFNEGATGVVADQSGAVVVTGTTNSSDFPTRFPFQSSHAGGVWDAFVTRFGDCTVPASVTALGATRFCPGKSVALLANDGPGFSWQWRHDGTNIVGAITRQFFAYDSGRYSVLVKTLDGCMSESPAIHITHAALAMNAGRDTLICEGGEAAIGSLPVGGTPPYTYLWAPATGLNATDVARPTARPVRSTTYHVLVVDSLGCMDADTVTVLVDTFAVSTDHEKMICKGNDTRLSLSIIGGIAPFRYFWTPATGLDRSDIPNPLAKPDSTTRYLLTVIDSNGCVRTDTTRVTVHSLTVDAGRDVEICPNGTTRLRAQTTSGSGPFTYRWEPATGLTAYDIPDPVASPVSSVVYRVTATDRFGCTSADLVSVKVRSAIKPAISASGPLIFCEGDSIFLTARGGFISYQWSTGERSRSIVAKRTGVYAVIAVDTLGCISGDSVQVFVYGFPAPVIRVEGRAVFCEGDSVVLDGGDGYNTYLWSTSEQTQRIVVRVSGSYSVRVQTPGGCAGTSVPVRVIVNPLPKPSYSGARTVCQNTEATYRANVVSGVRVSWNISGGIVQGSRDSVVITVLWLDSKTGLMRLTYTVDSSQCSATILDSVHIDQVLHPRIDPGGAISLCAGDSVVLDAGAGFQQYRWSTGDTTRTILVSSAGSYAVSVRDANGCSGTDSVRLLLRQRPAPLVKLLSAPPFCEGDSIFLDIDEGFERYHWSTGDTTRLLAVSHSGSYSAMVVDAFGCTGYSDTVIVSFNPKPEPLITGRDRFCRFDTATYQVRAIAGHSYTWHVVGGTLLSGLNSERVTVLWDGPEPAEISVTEGIDSTGCRSGRTMRVQLSEPPTPRIIPSGSVTICEGDSLELQLDSSYPGYHWSNLESSGSIAVRTRGVYACMVTDTNGCTGISDSVFVFIQPGPRPVVTGPSTVCRFSSPRYETDSDSGAIYTWSVERGSVISGQGTSSIRVLWDSLSPGRIYLSETIGTCIARDTLDVTIGTSLQPTIRVRGATAICRGDSVVLDAGPGYASYRWSTTDTVSSIVVRNTGDYSVLVRDSSGCSGTSSLVHIDVYDPSPPVITGARDFCAGDTIHLGVGMQYAAYLWSTGEATPDIMVDSAGSFSVTVVDTNGCRSTSPPVSIRMFPAPLPPAIRMRNDTLFTDAAAAYQWLYVMTAIPGANNRGFIPMQEGSYRVLITDTNGCTALSESYEVRFSEASCVFTLPSLIARPGERITIPISVGNSVNLSANTRHIVSATIVFNSGVLFPIAATPPGIVSGTERRIAIRTDSVMLRGTIATIELVAMLGNTDSTLVRLENPIVESTPVRISTMDGVVRIATCEEGGTRLFDGSGRMTLKQNYPNPFNASTRIQFDILEDGLTRLDVFDLLGRHVASLLSGFLHAGSHTVEFDAAGMPSGLYRCVLQTPTQRSVRVMQLLQ